MRILYQTLLVVSGTVTGIVAIGVYLAISSPAATIQLDYLLVAVTFLLGFALGSAVADSVMKRLSEDDQGADALAEPLLVRREGRVIPQPSQASSSDASAARD